MFFFIIRELCVDVLVFMSHGNLVDGVEVLTDLHCTIGNAVDERDVSGLEKIDGCVESSELGVHCQ